MRGSIARSKLSRSEGSARRAEMQVSSNKPGTLSRTSPRHARQIPDLREYRMPRDAAHPDPEARSPSSLRATRTTFSPGRGPCARRLRRFESQKGLEHVAAFLARWCRRCHRPQDPHHSREANNAPWPRRIADEHDVAVGVAQRACETRFGSFGGAIARTASESRLDSSHLSRDPTSRSSATSTRRTFGCALGRPFEPFDQLRDAAVASGLRFDQVVRFPCQSNANSLDARLEIDGNHDVPGLGRRRGTASRSPHRTRTRPRGRASPTPTSTSSARCRDRQSTTRPTGDVSSGADTATRNPASSSAGSRTSRRTPLAGSRANAARGRRRHGHRRRCRCDTSASSGRFAIVKSRCDGHERSLDAVSPGDDVGMSIFE